MVEYKIEDIKIIQPTEVPENLINGGRDCRNIDIKLMVSIPLTQNNEKARLVNLFFSDEIIGDEFETYNLRIIRESDSEQIFQIVKVALYNRENFLLKKFVKLALDSYHTLQLTDETIQFEVKSEHFLPKISPKY